jgi:predicted O-methyltransferase YrrM
MRIFKKSFKYWTMHYLINRALEIIYIKTRPNEPWLTKQANSILMFLLKKTDRGLEWGSGRSTIWFAKRVAHLTSIEHNKEWYERIFSKLKNEHIENVTYLFCETEEQKESNSNCEYVRIVDRFPNNSLDFVVVDGIYRDYCAYLVVDKICPGGVLIVDDVHRYLPSNSIAPHAILANGEPASLVWKDFKKLVKKRRCIWTSNGVHDTAIFIKS